jgi:fructose-bisphosphate aldolase class I
MSNKSLEATVSALMAPGRGILAADESTGTIEKRFKSVSVPCTVETRRQYREMLFATPGLNDFISGVILFEETLQQRSSTDVPLPQMLAERGIVPGIKVDRGTLALPGFCGEKVTEGLDGLAQRLAEYKKLGARFAKWRAVLAIGAGVPTAQAIAMNAATLAHYAAICQEQGLVPIVEPEVLMDGDHSIETCARVSEQVLHEVFHALHRQRVALELMLLKPNMVVPGASCTEQATHDEVAAVTLACLRRTVPAAVPGVYFLSGGQSERMATANLNAMNVGSVKQPWVLSFSYGRALQAPVLKAWRGATENHAMAQQALAKRARLNASAREGRYTAAMEQG